tara:strand:+ start:194 stop:682 length:489 start_codon:yes stop_codon:yes gene_type:complete
MAFTQSTFATVGAQSAPSPTVYSYISPDDLATVTTSSYFFDKRFQLDEGDWILCDLSDGAAILNVLADTSSAGIITIPINEELGIVEADANYQIMASDDIINCNGSFTVTFPPILTAAQSMKISSVNGTIVLAADATIQGSQSLTTGTGAEFYPARGQWWRG